MAEEENLNIIINTSVLKEVNFLVETPYVIVGEFKTDFLRLPDILIITEMEHHQRYFPLRRKDGSLSEKFLFVANIKNDNPVTLQNIKLGNERVLASRLSDGSFFYDEDRKQSLFLYVDNLKKIVYQANMGSMFDKKERLKTLATLFVKSTGYATDSLFDINRACDLVKADLTTNLVGEFDELQGEIGAIYAQLDQEPLSISTAIKEHYLPRFQGDLFPSTALGVVLSFVDKFDNIMAAFLLGKEPTSSQDPLAIRRQALYAIEILIQNRISLPLKDFLQEAILIYTSNDIALDIPSKIWEFLRIRFITIFDKQGFDKKLINASLYTDNQDIYDISLKLVALKDIQHNEDFTNIMISFNRMYNIINDFCKKKHLSLNTLAVIPNIRLFEKEQETALWQFSQDLQAIPKNVEFFYEALFMKIASSKLIIDNFFNEVMVMCDDETIRLNRLQLLYACVSPIQVVFNLELLK